MPFTLSIVLSTQNRGAICTMPPTETTTRMPIKRMSEFFSKTACCMAWASPGRNRSQFRGGGDWRLFFQIDGFVAMHRTPDIVCHDQCTDDEQDSTDRPNDVVGLHRFHSFYEGIL